MTETPAIQINRIGTKSMLVPVVGTAPLIMHRWSEKAKRQMLDKQQGRKTEKAHKDPEADYRESTYRTADGGYGFPTLGFKASMVSACRFYDKSVSMTAMRQFVFYQSEVMSEDGISMLTRITGEPRMREDMVTVGQTTDIRYRAEFPEWAAVLHVRWVTSQLNQESVLSLIEAGGFGVGVGEWRPEKSGQNGTFTIDTTKDLKILGE